MNQVQIEKFDEAGAEISFTASVQVPTDENKPFDVRPDDGVQAMTKVFLQAGSVGLFYNALIVEAVRIRDAPVSSKITASVNVV